MINLLHNLIISWAQLCVCQRWPIRRIRNNKYNKKNTKIVSKVSVPRRQEASAIQMAPNHSKLGQQTHTHANCISHFGGSLLSTGRKKLAILEDSQCAVHCVCPLCPMIWEIDLIWSCLCSLQMDRVSSCWQSGANAILIKSSFASILKLPAGRCKCYWNNIKCCF